MNKKTLIAIIIAFTLGFGVCYVVKASNTQVQNEIIPPITGLTKEESLLAEQSISSLANNLDGKIGSNLDLAFIENMIIYNEGAIAMAEKVVGTTKQSELTEMSEDIIITRRAEIEILNGWLNAWYGR